MTIFISRPYQVSPLTNCGIDIGNVAGEKELFAQMRQELNIVSCGVSDFRIVTFRGQRKVGGISGNAFLVSTGNLAGNEQLVCVGGIIYLAAL